MVYFYGRMRVATDQHSYRETGMFSNLILDYLADCPELRSLHLGLPSMERIGEAIQRRKQVQTDRSKLVEALRRQYATVKVDAKSQVQIDSLESENTFTVTTAHQCNLFLGPTYTIFKILHTIKMADAINAAFTSFDEFKTKVNAAAVGRFGSGWAWLVKDASGKLVISSTPNQDNPLMDVAEVKGTPILGADVWEHAYYLKFLNKRADYVDAFMSCINWNEVNRLRLEK